MFCVALHVQQTLEPLFTVSRLIKRRERDGVYTNLQLGADAVKPYSRLCSRHFPGGDPSKEPQLNLGKRFASPRKRDHPRARRARLRDFILFFFIKFDALQRNRQ